MNSHVNNGLGVIMMCQCRVIGCNRYTTLMRNVDNGGRLCLCEDKGNPCVFS